LGRKISVPNATLVNGQDTLCFQDSRGWIREKETSMKTPYCGSAVMDKEEQYDWERLKSIREKHPVKYHKLILEDEPPVIMSSNLYKQHPWVKAIEDYDNTLPTWTRIAVGVTDSQ
jgi:hypothetical protein